MGLSTDIHNAIVRAENSGFEMSIKFHRLEADGLGGRLFCVVIECSCENEYGDDLSWNVYAESINEFEEALEEALAKESEWRPAQLRTTRPSPSAKPEVPQ